MGERISWSINVQVAGGPKISLSRSLDVDAYDKLSVPVAAGATGESAVPVEVQPASEAGRVLFLLISADRYDIENLACEVRDGEATTLTLPLDGPQVLMGPGAISLLGATPPQTLYFTNGLESEARVDILVGRKATPSAGSS